MNAATPEQTIRVCLQLAATVAASTTMEGSAARQQADAALLAFDELVAENARYGDAIRDILDVCVGWTRTMTDAEKLAAIEKFAREALAGSGGDTTNG